MQTTFYDRNGTPTAYIEDGVHIFLFNGKPVGYIDGISIFAYSGRHLGWFEDNWVRDHWGNCVFFTDETSGGGPVKPVRGVKPVKGVKHVKPVKGVKEVKPVKAVKSLSWSETSDQSFFP